MIDANLNENNELVYFFLPIYRPHVTLLALRIDEQRE